MLLEKIFVRGNEQEGLSIITSDRWEYDDLKMNPNYFEVLNLCTYKLMYMMYLLFCIDSEFG